MKAFLKFIEVENFKSYKGYYQIGPLKPFTAVIGPNGSGKSNFMDAISFVMGEKTSSLRVKRLSDLIHGASIGQPISRSAQVTAIFDMGNGVEKRFTRLVQGSSSDHRINNEVVSSQQYLKELERLGINVKGKNFLVFQGAVESIAMKNPKERTLLFEEIILVLSKKNMSGEKQIELQLFRLYHNEKEIAEFEKEAKRKQAEIEKVEKKKEKAEEVLKEKKKEQGRVSREMAKLEQDIREMESEVNKKRPTFIKAKERVTHMQKKVDSARKSLAQAIKAHNAHMDDIRDLENELQEVEKKRTDFEDQVNADSLSQGRSVQLEEVQVKEYQKLKNAAARKSAQYLQELDSINREQKSDQDRLDNLQRRSTEIENRLKQKGHELEEAQKRVEKLHDHIRQSETSLEDQLKLRQEQLDSVTEQLGDARVDKHEDSRRKKKQEIVENFKELYSGVYDRMINMCQPIHKRYNVAITKVLGKYMEAIVVDTEKTARQCVQYLKDQMLDPETFLPLDYIQAKPLKERLRNINQPRNVKLLYDVLQYDPPEIKRAVLFATNNALVCETPDDATKVAYEMEDGHRYDAVALDGTFFSKSGIISGGSLDLARKAKRWDEKHLSNLKQQKEKLSEDLREAMKKSRKESELNTVESQIRGLETRLKYSKTDRESTEKQVAQLEKEIEKLKVELGNFEPQVHEITKLMSKREATISDVKEKMNCVEDVVFADFCKQINVENIRQYEERELRAQTDRANKRFDFENQKNRILNQLEFEKSRDTQSNVARWERTVQDDEDALEQAKQAEQKQMAEIDRAMRDLDKKRSEKLAKKSELDEMDDEIGKAKREVAAIGKDIQSVQKQITSAEHKIEQKRAERHSILKQCKMDDILVPMTRGNMEDIENEAAGESVEYSSGLDTMSMYEKEARIVLDYSSLGEHHKELDDSDDVRKMENKMQKHINELMNIIQRIQAPNMKAMQKLEFAREKLHETNEEFDNARKRAKKSKQAFEKVKKERYDRFMSFFEHVSNEIDGIYKALAKNQSAQAFLGPENPEEPYLDGVNYNCVAPGKRFQPMSNLSGGEKTIAALALLFAIHSYQPAPFFVLDEIDAALDNTNIGKVARYIVDKKDHLQTIVISLKEEFYQNSDALVGICPDPGECLISRVLTVDLEQYPYQQQEEDGFPPR
ncbi:Structural maintenance of chromosomes protein 1A [Armadillidium nasatum]|uniref:Structural maintenance of chromosomes protein n=1 Tax=Armadillidium nasatum TaxID=96803 RepID=A0A5N5SPB5_9CRUS|nr:Structural maintenance of chromosomes protein 1A [Armadillidium nasatum]